MNPGSISVRAFVLAACLLAHGSSCGDDDDSRTTEVGDTPDAVAETDAPESEADLPEVPNRPPTFGYDVDGRRVLRESAGSVTRYVVDRQSATGYDQIVEERSAGGDVQAAFVFGHGPLALERGGSVRYFGGDPHGNTRS